MLQKEKIDHIYCSPFLRTVQTAHQVANELSLPVKIEYGLSEGLLKSESCISIPATQTTYLQLFWVASLGFLCLSAAKQSFQCHRLSAPKLAAVMCHTVALMRKASVCPQISNE